MFDESQVYRIDHYLGKETVQNLLVFRFGNGIFEPLWNRNYIDHVQITAAESLGVERRAAFYESAGALRDMIQSHVLQLTSLVAMEAPATFDATSVRNEKIKILQSIRPFTPETVCEVGGARPVRAGNDERQGCAGLPAGTGREAGFDDGDIRGAETAGGQLAMERRAVLSAHREAAGAADDGNRDPVQAGAAHGVSRARACSRIRWC